MAVQDEMRLWSGVSPDHLGHTDLKVRFLAGQSHVDQSGGALPRFSPPAISPFRVKTFVTWWSQPA